MNAIAVAVLLLLGAPQGQEGPRRIEFQFRDAPADAVFQFVTRETGLIVVNRANFHGTISAHGTTEADIDAVVAFLDAALRGAGHAAVRRGDYIVVLTVEQARVETPDIVVVRTPSDVEQTEQIKTFLITLRNLNAVDAEKELKSLFPQGAQVAVNRHSNSIVITDAGINVRRIVEILSLLDVQMGENLSVRVFPLRNADAQQMVDLINQLFLARSNQEQEDQLGGWGRIIRMFVRRGEEQDAGPQGRAAPAGSVVRVAADIRTNSVIVGSTPENIELIGQLIAQLDEKTPEATRIAVYPLRYADATEVAKLINEVFRQPATPNQDRSRQQSAPRWAWWANMMQGQQDVVSSSIGVRAAADTRTNTVVVTAGERQLVLVEQLVTELDRQVSDLLRLKVYTLRNADAEEMKRIIEEVLRPQSAASSQPQQASTNVPRWAQVWLGAQQESESVSRYAQLEVTADKRTNSLIVKATAEYMEELDAPPGSEIQTFVIPVRDRRADEVADLLRALTGQAASRRSEQARNSRNPQQQNLQGLRSFFNSGGTQGRGGSGGTNPFSGFRIQPMSPPQDAPQEERQQEAQPAPAGTGLSGQLDIEADNETNSLVVRTSRRNIEEIRRLLGDLDRPVPQAMIRVLIADVSLDDATSLGVEATWRTESPLGDLQLSTDFEALNQTNVGQGAFLFRITGDHVDASLTALAREGRAKVLASPRVLVANNQQAQIQIGDQVPLITSSRIDQTSGDTINTIQYTDVGIILNVRPTINPSGLVTLEVTPEVSALDQTRQVPISSNATAPTITRNRAQTIVTVRHGQTVVIGGLIREQDERIRQKVPILGDIPVLGFLFGKTDAVKRRRELMIFLTPYVVSTQPQLEELTALERARLRLLDERDVEDEVQRWDRFLRD
jgi:general secretion pathway protein D